MEAPPEKTSTFSFRRNGGGKKKETFSQQRHLEPPPAPYLASRGAARALACAQVSGFTCGAQRGRCRPHVSGSPRSTPSSLSQQQERGATEPLCDASIIIPRVTRISGQHSSHYSLPAARTRSRSPADVSREFFFFMPLAKNTDRSERFGSAISPGPPLPAQRFRCPSEVAADKCHGSASDRETLRPTLPCERCAGPLAAERVGTGGECLLTSTLSVPSDYWL